MSVYTRITEDELRAFLAGYPVDDLLDFRGISAGITNTNFFVDTQDGHWVLTLFEHYDQGQQSEDLPYFLGLMDHLARRGIPSASPQPDRQGRLLTELKGKPAALVHCLDGEHIDEVSIAHCTEMGQVLAEMHAAGHSYDRYRSPDRGLDWCKNAARQIHPNLNPDDQALLDETLQQIAATEQTDLPQGVIHADLFRDNVLFSGHQLTGLIDFYYACNGPLLYDLAIVVNDWCIKPDGLDHALYKAFISAYAAERAFTDAEKHHWPSLLKAAALRFWLSRLLDQLSPREGELTQIKDPAVFRNILAQHHQGSGPSLG